jgi:Holliday junction resolvasome RuvABC endonuclease subunit
MAAILAIDPGLSGGIAWAAADGTVSAIPMPIAGKELDLATLKAVIQSAAPSWVVLEKVGSMPGQGVASTFKFGTGWGMAQGLAAGLGLPLELVTPQRWKRVVLHGTAKDKDAAIAFCRRAFPGVELVPPRCRKAHDGMADALCMLEYGRRTLA